MLDWRHGRGKGATFPERNAFPLSMLHRIKVTTDHQMSGICTSECTDRKGQSELFFCRYACKYHALWISLSHTLWISSPTLTMMLPGLPVGSGMPHHIICLWVLSLYQNKKEATDHWEKVLCFTGRLDQDWHSRCFRRQQDPSVFTPWHVTILHFEGYCVLATQDLLILKKNAVRVDLDALCRHARQSNADMMIVGFIHSTLGLE